MPPPARLTSARFDGPEGSPAGWRVESGEWVQGGRRVPASRPGWDRRPGLARRARPPAGPVGRRGLRQVPERARRRGRPGDPLGLDDLAGRPPAAGEPGHGRRGGVGAGGVRPADARRRAVRAVAIPRDRGPGRWRLGSSSGSTAWWSRPARPASRRSPPGSASSGGRRDRRPSTRTLDRRTIGLAESIEALRLSETVLAFRARNPTSRSDEFFATIAADFPLRHRRMDWMDPATVDPRTSRLPPARRGAVSPRLIRSEAGPARRRGRVRRLPWQGSRGHELPTIRPDAPTTSPGPSGSRTPSSPRPAPGTVGSTNTS